MTVHSYDLDIDSANQDLAKANSPGGGGTRDKRVFKAKPTKDGQTYVNHLFIASVKPRELPGFESYPLDHRLFYVKLFGHYVEVPTDDNKVRSVFVLCQKQMNAHAAGLAKDKNFRMFSEDRCPDCQAAEATWDQYGNRWAELGYPDKASRQKLSKEDYKALASDPQLDALKKTAMDCQFKIRYALPVYNLELQPLEIGYQWFFAAEGVFKDLMGLVTQSVRFWSLNPHPTTPGAVEGAEILLTKDTTNGVRRCEYSVGDNRAALQMQPDEIEYLQNPANLPPLFEEGLIQVLSYEQFTELRQNGGIAPTEGAEEPAGEPAPASVAPPAASRAPAAPARAPAPVGATRTPQAAQPAARPAARPAAPAPAARPAAPPVAPPAGAARPAARRTW